MLTADRLHPFDVVLAIRLLRSSGTLQEIAAELSVAPSQVHAALGRLRLAGLLRAEGRATNSRALGELLLGGVRYVFPARRGPLVEGIPTAYSAPPLAALFDAVDVVVWPAPKHGQAVRGFGITPLYPKAPALLERAPDTYQLLSIVDALRIGEPRVRSLARTELEARIRSISE
jgi:hypothetical protein